MKSLMEDYEYRNRQYEEVMGLLSELCIKVPESAEMLAIKGIGIITVSGFLAEVGDVGHFDDGRQIQKLAGLSLRECSSGKHKGETTISRRGRSRLRTVLFNAAISVVSRNDAFKSIHRHYTTRKDNQLKKKQSIVAISCKLIRVFFAILAKGAKYDEKHLVADIRWPDTIAA